MTIRAKFKVRNIRQYKSEKGEVYQETVQMAPVYSDDPTSENHQFWQATPAGDLNMYINNPRAFGIFELDKEYYLDFTPAD